MLVHAQTASKKTFLHFHFCIFGVTQGPLWYIAYSKRGGTALSYCAESSESLVLENKKIFSRSVAQGESKLFAAACLAERVN